MTVNINVNLPRAIRLRLTKRTEATLMSALTNLNLAIGRLTTAVDRLASGGGVGGGVPEADVQAAADAVTAQSQRLEALPTPSNGDPNGLSEGQRHK